MVIFVKLSEINIRDPFILPFDNKYYMYGSRVGVQTGFDVYESTDLEEWSKAKSVFEMTDDFWATRDAWAPEVHFYKGKFYMFASFKSPNTCRGTQILVSNTPDGKFVPLTKKPITPSDWECLDGTFYIDKNGKPHIIFCHEWVQIENGTVCEMQLSPDLTCAVSKPRILWGAKDYEDVCIVGKDIKGYVTDGPFLYRNHNDKLLAIWSSFNKNGYAALVSQSDNGDINGNWSVCKTPLSAVDGGHGMIFKAFDGKDYFIMHKPNTATLERPVITELKENSGNIFI